MPTSASSVRPSTSGEQVGVRVERRRVEVPARRREHAQPLLAEPLVLGDVALAGTRRRSRSATRSRVASVVRRAREQLVRRALDEAAHDVAARLVLHPVEGRHQLVRGVERQLGDARVRLARRRRRRGRPSRRGRRARPRSGRRSCSPSCTTASEASTIGSRNWSSGTSGSPDDVLDRPLGRVAAAGDRVAAARDRQLDRRHLVQRQRPGLVGVDRRRRAERLGRAQPLHDRVRLREHAACPSRGSSSRPRAGRSGSPRRRTRSAAVKTVVEGLAAREVEHDRDRRPRAPAMTRIWLVSFVELLRQRRLDVVLGAAACARCGRPRSTSRSP